MCPWCGYLSSLVTGRTGVGAADCPWLLRAGSGQRISLSLLDFTVAGRRSSTSHQLNVENEAAVKASPASSQRCVLSPSSLASTAENELQFIILYRFTVNQNATGRLSVVSGWLSYGRRTGEVTARSVRYYFTTT